MYRSTLVTKLVHGDVVWGSGKAAEVVSGGILIAVPVQLLFYIALTQRLVYKV